LEGIELERVGNLSHINQRHNNEDKKECNERYILQRDYKPNCCRSQQRAAILKWSKEVMEKIIKADAEYNEKLAAATVL
jgi:hypothetical protein